MLSCSISINITFYKFRYLLFISQTVFLGFSYILVYMGLFVCFFYIYLIITYAYVFLNATFQYLGPIGLIALFIISIIYAKISVESFLPIVKVIKFFI